MFKAAGTRQPRCIPGFVAGRLPEPSGRGRSQLLGAGSGFRRAWWTFALNFTPGLVGGLPFAWNRLAAVLLGGATYISSSGVIAKVLTELPWTKNPETPNIC